MAKRGRKPTTGRFETRQELVDKVAYLFINTRCSISRIAENCGISVGTVDKIVANEIFGKRKE